MTEQEWLSATDEERNAEYERCKDPVYYFNNYFVTENGVKQPPMTLERWVEIEAQIAYLRDLRFKRLED